MGKNGTKKSTETKTKMKRGKKRNKNVGKKRKNAKTTRNVKKGDKEDTQLKKTRPLFSYSWGHKTSIKHENGHSLDGP